VGVKRGILESRAGVAGNVVGRGRQGGMAILAVGKGRCSEQGR
jgi:hypothetical protein